MNAQCLVWLPESVGPGASNFFEATADRVCPCVQPEEIKGVVEGFGPRVGVMLLGRISEEATSRRSKEALKMKRTAVRITKVQGMRPRIVMRKPARRIFLVCFVWRTHL